MQAELTLEGRISAVIAPSLEQMGYEIVRVRVLGSDSSKILQVMLDRIDGVTIGIDDCQKASKQMSAILDVEESILEEYALEVSSPGIDRPLTRLKDFERFKGLEAKIEVVDKIADKRKIRGRLAGLEGDEILFDLNVVSLEKPQAERIKIKFENIKSANLVLNDELLGFNKSNNI
jgi:ribosome maturation factor RimP